MNKNKNKIFTFLFLSAVGMPTFAQGVIYKCTDPNGDVSYTTEIANKNCEKTNLAKIDRGNIMNKPGLVSNSNNSAVQSTSTAFPTVGSSDQIVRDQKRAMILQGELSQEKNQLKTISEMILKANKSDKNQIEQLKQMEQTHKRNIASLEKELGIKSNSNANAQIALTPAPNNILSGLPFNLPKKASEVQLVETPKMHSTTPQYAPRTPYVLINPSSVAKAPINTNTTLAKPIQQQVAVNSGIQNAQPIIIKEYRQPAAISNKSIKNKVTPQE